jgi:hypothetical protein
VESDTNSDSEDGDLVRNLNEADDLNVDSLHLSEQVVYPLAFYCHTRYTGYGKWCVLVHLFYFDEFS